MVQSSIKDQGSRVKPSDLNAAVVPHAAFDQDTAPAARTVLLFAQRKGGWHDFTPNEVRRVVGEKVCLTQLVKAGFIHWHGHNRYAFTDLFLETYAQHYPTRRLRRLQQHSSQTEEATTLPLIGEGDLDVLSIEPCPEAQEADVGR